MKAKRWLSAVLLLAAMAGAASPVQAAASQKQESGRSQEGVEYTLSYPEIRGTITAEFTSLNEGWEGDGQPHTRTVKLLVVASGDPFVLRFKSGLTSARCSDCDAGENPLCTPVVFGVGTYTLTERGYFEWRGYAGARFAQQANTMELDCEADRVGMMAIEKLSIDPDPHMGYAPGNVNYQAGGDNTHASAQFDLNVGFYLRLPESTIRGMDFSKTYDTEDLKALIEGKQQTTYGKASVEFKGYTIDKNNVGRMLIDVTNNTGAPDEGDLFYLVYSKFINKSEMIDAGVYVPDDYIRKIHYEVPANSTKTLSIPVTYLAQYDEEITDKQLAAGWQDRENVESSRIILAQAETPEEAQELTEFFRAAHDYGEMTLSDEPDENGVTTLAKPMSRVSRGKYLDQKLSAFTSKF